MTHACPCGRNIEFDYMGENIIVGINECDYDEYLRIAPIVNWDYLHQEASKEEIQSHMKRIDEIEDKFYHCKCGRLLWKKPDQEEVLVFEMRR